MILDVRSEEEWTRDVQTGATVPGHIPGAAHLVWTDVLDPATKRFKPAAALDDLFRQAGVSPDSEILPYCHAEIRAAHTVFALKVAGYPKVWNYEGSWLAWSSADRPIEAHKVAGLAVR